MVLLLLLMLVRNGVLMVDNDEPEDEDDKEVHSLVVDFGRKGSRFELAKRVNPET